MNFKLPYSIEGTVPPELLNTADAGIVELEQTYKFPFKMEKWERLDSYNNPYGITIEDIIGADIVNHVMSHYPDHMLFGWSISSLPGKSTVADHTDRVFFHRLAKRVIVPTNQVPDVLNWVYSTEKITRRYFEMPRGNIYRLNTAVTHGVANNNLKERRAVYFDIMPTRLYNKFKQHVDLLAPLLSKPVPDSPGERNVL